MKQITSIILCLFVFPLFFSAGVSSASAQDGKTIPKQSKSIDKYIAGNGSAYLDEDFESEYKEDFNGNSRLITYPDFQAKLYGFLKSRSYYPEDSAPDSENTDIQNKTLLDLKNQKIHCGKNVAQFVSANNPVLDDRATYILYLAKDGVHIGSLKIHSERVYAYSPMDENDSVIYSYVNSGDAGATSSESWVYLNEKCEPDVSLSLYCDSQYFYDNHIQVPEFVQFAEYTLITPKGDTEYIGLCLTPTAGADDEDIDNVQAAVNSIQAFFSAIRPLRTSPYVGKLFANFKSQEELKKMLPKKMQSGFVITHPQTPNPCEKWENNKLFQNEQTFNYELYINDSYDGDDEESRDITVEATCTTKILPRKDRCISKISCAVPQGIEFTDFSSLMLSGYWSATDKGYYFDIMEPKAPYKDDDPFIPAKVRKPISKSYESEDSGGTYSTEISREGKTTCREDTADIDDYSETALCFDEIKGIVSTSKKYAAGIGEHDWQANQNRD